MSSLFYTDVSSATHQANYNTNRAANLRLVAVTMRNSGGNPLYTAAWVPNDSRTWVAIQDATLDQLNQFYTKYKAQGMEMKALASTETLFAAVMESTNTGTQFVTGLTDATLPTQLNANQTQASNLAPRAFAIYGAPGATRRYAVIFEPCNGNWSYRLWDTDTVATQAISAFFNDLRYRPTLLTYSADGFIFAVFRDSSIGADNWTASTGMSVSELTATYNSFSGRGLWPLSLSANDSDKFASVMVKTETLPPQKLSIQGSDTANLATKMDPFIGNLLIGGGWTSVGRPRSISVAIAYQQRLMYAKAFTFADSNYPVTTPNSTFRLASCSKPITSIAIGRLIQDGLVSESDTVAKANLTPTPGGAFPAGFNNITIGQLRTHRSGIQPWSGSDTTVAAAYGHPTPISIYELMSYTISNSTISPGFSPTSTTVQYQNCNFALLGMIIRSVTSGLYTDYVSQKLFGPLGITRPSVGASLHSQRSTLEVQHHSSNPSSVGTNLVCSDPPLVGSGYGTGISENFEGFEDWSFSPVDYVAILATVGAANTGNHPILNNAAITRMYTKMDPTGVKNNFTYGGLFWGTSPAGVTVFGHNGGWSSGGLNIASWIISRSDGVSAAVFMNMDDPGSLGAFAWGEGANHALSGNLQTTLDNYKWPATGDLFPTFGINAL